MVKKVLKEVLATDFAKERKQMSYAKNEDSVISMLIHDIFGGEILKTPDKKGWHFYNKINGENIDFSQGEIEKATVNKKFSDIPATPDETSVYFDKNDYSTFFTRFITTFEETLGLGQCRYGLSG